MPKKKELEKYYKRIISKASVLHSWSIESTNKRVVISEQVK